MRHFKKLLRSFQNIIRGSTRFLCGLLNAGYIRRHFLRRGGLFLYLSDRLGLCELTRTTRQHNQQTGSNQGSLTLGNIVQAISSQNDIAAGLDKQGKSVSQGSSFSASEQLQKVNLMTPDEVGRYFSRESGAVLALIAGALPIRLERLAAHKDPFFIERAATNPFHRNEGKKPDDQN